ncbi:DUF1361 domain-containing protein [Aequorivita lipolytica]|uniref:DUF1361 domain-containing protein n=1 Tax=Aequorivita lipolytica TaxID=153267 RepID=A0A5C6YPN7_9FLAO|nr:DUF1361 domain-containing protein [Aequorivita lipolytica]TXD68986.1 DUF1361 domain-containing protein [Aequorivita lipolytica]SRX52999.1 hypothetical protein AEQU2_02261 [Aequorivita lipolytica]
MKTLKTFLFNRFHILFPLFSLTVLSILLLSVRLKITHSFFYLFLVWNLFLAMIPFFISTLMKTIKQLKKPMLTFLLLAWLLFLPNAPYLLTDFIHLRLSPLEWLGFDSFMIAIFAITGLAFYVISVKDVKPVLLKHFNQRIVLKCMAILPFLVSFGMYLGRILRWNTWDILHKPFGLFTDVFAIITNPIENSEAWFFTLFFGLFLKLAYWCFEKYLFGYLKA